MHAFAVQVLLVVGAFAATSASAFDMSTDGWLDVLTTEAAQSRPWPVLSDYVLHLDPESAYRLQDGFFAQRGQDRIAGYVAAFRDPRDRTFNAPISGLLPAAGERPNRATLRLDQAPYDSAVLRVGFVLRSAITRRMRSIDDLATYLRDTVVAIELPQGRFENEYTPRAADWIAVNLGLHEWIRSQPLPAMALDGLDSLALSLTLNGEVFATTSAAAAGRRTTDDLLWLVNHLVDDGRVLAPGNVLLVAAALHFGPLEPGRYAVKVNDRVVIEFNATAGRHRAAGVRRPH